MSTRTLSDLLPTIEGVGVTGSVAGLLFTLISVVVMARGIVVVVAAIRRNEASWSGPRWRFVFGLCLSMLLFLPGWLCFLALAIIMSVVPNPSVDEPERLVRVVIFASVLVLGQLSFACGQCVMAGVWFWVRAAPPFLPTDPVESRPSPPGEHSHA